MYLTFWLFYILNADNVRKEPRKRSFKFQTWTKDLSQLLCAISLMYKNIQTCHSDLKSTREFKIFLSLNSSWASINFKTFISPCNLPNFPIGFTLCVLTALPITKCNLSPVTLWKLCQVPSFFFSYKIHQYNSIIKYTNILQFTYQRQVQKWNF